MSKKRFYTNIGVRVGHAYYKYGRFCSSHPIANLLWSIGSLLFVSYPLTRLNLISSGPFDTVIADNLTEYLSSNDVGDVFWLRRDSPPSAFIQQIFIRTKVDPWNSTELTVKDAIKGPMRKAFDLFEDIRDFRTKDNLDLENFCFNVFEPDPGLRAKMLPDHKCLILSPAQFWHNNRDKFHDDDYIFDTIFTHTPCTNTLCVRNLLFGMPVRLTGLKRQYHSNRERLLQFAVTIVFVKYDMSFMNQLRTFLANKYPGALSDLSDFTAYSKKDLITDDANKYVHIYYNAQKNWDDYVPLFLSYLFVFGYLYFSLRKIENVKSKWGLAFSAVFTIASSLVMATGICIYFDLTPRLWSGELFPYLALILGIENMLCITRSVVLTPVTLDVKSRIAHGLSKEGWAITKNFLTELGVVTVGLVTRIPQIQEFCTLAFIGLVVDFYMQLFFYAPCLTFDMNRITQSEKEKLALMQLARKRDLQFYPPCQCPFSRVFSFLFHSEKDLESEARVARARTLSSMHQDEVIEATVTDSSDGSSVQRRAINTPAANVPLIMEQTQQGANGVPRRFIPLRFLASRSLSKIVLVLLIIWTVCLMFSVHQWRVINDLSNVFSKSEQTNQQTIKPSPTPFPKQMTPSLKETSWIEWDLWQRQSFRTYPSLFHEYNVSLADRYITLLPPIILETNVSPEEAKLVRAGGQSSKVEIEAFSTVDKATGKLYSSDLRLRISWLELQMLIVLILSCGIFITVAGFIIYVCCISGNESFLYSITGISDKDNAVGVEMPKKTLKRVGSKTIVESIPILFTGHGQDVEFLCSTKDFLISSCLDGKIIIWDAKNGDMLRSIQSDWRNQTSSDATRDQNERASGTSSNVRISHETLMRHRSTEPSTTSKASTSNATVGFDFNRTHSTSKATCDQAVARKLLDLNSNVLSSPAVWCMAAQNSLLCIGLADGSLELYEIGTGIRRYQYRNCAEGPTQICLKGSRIVVARANGQLDFLELRLVQNRPPTLSTAAGASTQQSTGSCLSDGTLQCHLLQSLTAHQHPINCLKTTNIHVITASEDHTLKIFDLHKCQYTHSLYGHNSSVIDVVIDENLQYIYSTCSDGLICVWDLTTGGLMKTIIEVSYASAPPVTMALSSTMLVGLTQDGSVWMWKTSTFELITRIKPDNVEVAALSCLNSASLVVLSDVLAVSACGNAIRFWDLKYKVVLREVKLDDDFGDIKQFIPLDAHSVACCKGSNVYRVNLPVIKLK